MDGKRADILRFLEGIVRDGNGRGCEVGEDLQG